LDLSLPTILSSSFDAIFYERFLLSLSMSISAPVSAPLAGPSITTTPTGEPAGPDTKFPSMNPTFIGSSIPSIDPITQGPTSSPVPFPSQHNASALPELAFDCVNNGTIRLGEANDANTTGVFLFVGYSVQSSTVSTDGFIDELEHQLLLTAVSAALGCHGKNRRSNRALHESRKLLMKSIVVGKHMIDSENFNQLCLNNLRQISVSTSF
jgi:hypothetical protein